MLEIVPGALSDAANPDVERTGDVCVCNMSTSIEVSTESVIRAGIGAQSTVGSGISRRTLTGTRFILEVISWLSTVKQSGRALGEQASSPL